MSEEGTLSIVRRGRGYQVRYASNNPYDPERPPHACPDEETLSAFLGSVAKLGFGGKIRKSGLGKSIACELQLSCFR